VRDEWFRRGDTGRPGDSDQPWRDPVTRGGAGRRRVIAGEAEDGGRAEGVPVAGRVPRAMGTSGPPLQQYAIRTVS
jgi:hypothetical protein